MLKASNCLTYFTTHQWTFKSNNVVALLDEMSEHDRQEFHFDLKVGAASVSRSRINLGIRLASDERLDG